MTFEETLFYLAGAEKYTSLGLERIESLLRLLGSPQEKLRFVHAAGTNGKGSTCAMIYSILGACGLKAGLFISPYLEDICEHISSGGAAVTRERFAELMTEIRAVAEEMLAGGEPHPSSFEMLTAAALLYFEREGCDIAVMETGLGGRLDATNVIPAPIVCAVTPVSVDHSAELGGTVREIALEKAGIIKSGCVCVTAAGQDRDALTVIEAACLEKGVRLTVPDEGALEVLRCSESGSRIVYRGMTLDIPLVGRHQIQNALTAIEAALVLRGSGYSLPESGIAEGLRAVRWSGRLEAVRERPLCLLDGAHNPGGVNVLLSALEEIYSGRRVITVMGMLKNKDYRHCVPRVAAASDVFIAASTGGARALPASSVAEAATGHCADIREGGTLENCLKTALSEAKDSDIVLVCGSLTVIGGAKRLLADTN